MSTAAPTGDFPDPPGMVWTDAFGWVARMPSQRWLADATLFASKPPQPEPCRCALCNDSFRPIEVGDRLTIEANGFIRIEGPMVTGTLTLDDLAPPPVPFHAYPVPNRLYGATINHEGDAV